MLPGRIASVYTPANASSSALDSAAVALSFHIPRQSVAEPSPNEPAAVPFTSPSGFASGASVSDSAFSALPALAAQAIVADVASNAGVNASASQLAALNVQFVPQCETLPLVFPFAETVIVAKPKSPSSSTYPVKVPTAQSGSGSTVIRTSKVSVVFPSVVTVNFTAEGTARPVFASILDAAVGAPYTVFAGTSTCLVLASTMSLSVNLRPAGRPVALTVVAEMPWEVTDHSIATPQKTLVARDAPDCDAPVTAVPSTANVIAARSASTGMKQA